MLHFYAKHAERLMSVGTTFQQFIIILDVDCPLTRAIGVKPDEATMLKHIPIN